MNRLGRAATVVGLLLGLVGVAACSAPEEDVARCGTALLVIDVQNAYVDQLDLTTSDGVQLVDKLVGVLVAARAAGLPIVYVKHRDRNYPAGSTALDNPPAISPLPGDPVIWKTHQNAFWDTELDGVLTVMGVSRLLLTGLSTIGCLNATAFGAKGLGYETWIVADAHGGAGSGVCQYYNESWPSTGFTVKLFKDIDLAAFGCSAPQP